MITHISYSQYNTYTNCPRSWYLGKVRKAEEKQTWYIPIGTAVHSMVEAYLADPSQLPSAEEFFYPLISAQMQVEPDLSKWLAGGSREAPATEDRALQQVKDCFARALEFLDDIDVWEVELDVSWNLPGLEVPVKAYADVIGEHKKHGPTILDWKTGSSKPKDAFQLETYAALLLNPTNKSYEIHDFTGVWAMLKPGTSVAKPIDLSDVKPAEVGALYQAVYEKMKAKLYPTKHGFNCNFCFHQENCLLTAGPTARAVYYDRAHEDGYPF